MKKNSAKLLNKMVQHAARNSANSTSSFTMFQPKAPEALKNFSKVENDK